MSRKRWWRSPAVLCPDALVGICPGGQDTMAQFLQVPAKEKVVSVVGFVQSRNHGVGKRTISFVSR